MAHRVRGSPDAQFVSGASADPNAAQGGYVGEDALAHGVAVPLVVGVQELVLYLCHIHLGGALRLARLALQAQVQHLVHPIAGELILGEQAGDGRPEGVGAAPGGVLLLTGSHVRGTHRAVEGSATEPHSVTHLHRAVETALGGEAELGRGRKAACRQGRT